MSPDHSVQRQPSQHSLPRSVFQCFRAVIIYQSKSFSQCKTGLCILPLRRSQAVFLSHHLTAPVIPLAKLFCRQRKIIAVGSVQIKTPNINMP